MVLSFLRNFVAQALEAEVEPSELVSSLLLAAVLVAKETCNDESKPTLNQLLITSITQLAEAYDKDSTINSIPA